MKKAISLALITLATSTYADNEDCLGNDLATSMGAGATAWFGPKGLILHTDHPHIRYVPTEPRNTFVEHYGVLLDDPATPNVNEAGTMQYITPPVWKVGTSDKVETSEYWWRCGITGATEGYDLTRYSKVVLIVRVYKVGTNTKPIAKAECVLSRGN